MLGKEEVLHIAELCQLTLSQEEVEKLSRLLGETIDFIKVLEELDTENVKETYHVTGLTNVFQRPEEENTTLTREEALQNANEVINNMFATRAIFDRK